MFNILKEIKKGDYRYALVPGHPSATKNGYVLMHRVVVENHIGRLLGADEEVHHIDKNPFNNDMSNLMLLTKDEHRAIHDSDRKAVPVTLVCYGCGKWFDRERRQVKKSSKSFCGRDCYHISLRKRSVSSNG